jgi:hypothetical protein
MRITKEDLQKRCDAQARELAAYQEYVLLSIRCHGVPDAIETVIVEGEEHTFKLFGVRRSAGGVLLHTVDRGNGTLSPEVLLFDDAFTAWRATSYHGEAWKIRDAMDRLALALKVILDAERVA